MPNFDSTLVGSVYPVEPIHTPVRSDTDNTIDGTVNGAVKSTTQARPGQQAKPQRQQAACPGSGAFYSDVLFDKIYLEPVLIDAGLIIETQVVQIKVWNAFLNQVSTITNIQAINAAGTILDAPSPPIEIPKGWDAEYDLTILKDGPPVQNTQYIFSVAFQSFTVVVKGTRIVAFTYEPNWGNGISVKYRFFTVMRRSKQLREQRRPLLVNPLREISCSMWFNQDRLRKFLHDMRAIYGSVLAIPIYTEPLTTASDPQGQTIVTVEQDISKHWNLQRLTTLMMFLDRDNQFNSELKTLDSISGTNQLVFDQPVLGSYFAGRLVIYPVMVGLISGKTLEAETDDVVQVRMDLREILPDSGG